MTIDRADFPDDARRDWLAWQDAMLVRWRRFAHYLSAPPSEVDDLVQETALRTLKKHLHEPFPAMGDTLKYGAAVLRNLLYDYRHDLSRREVPVDDVTDTAVDPDPLPEEVVADRELHRFLDSAIEDLPPKYRDAIRTRLSGLTYAQAATLLGIKESTYGKRLHDALTRLRIKFGGWLTQHVPVPILSWPVGRKVRTVLAVPDPSNARHGLVAGLLAALTLATPVAQSFDAAEVRRVPPPRAAAPFAPETETHRAGRVPSVGNVASEMPAPPLVAPQVSPPIVCLQVQPLVTANLPTCRTQGRPPPDPPLVQWRAIRVPEPLDAATWEDPVVNVDPPPAALPVVPSGA